MSKNGRVREWNGSHWVVDVEGEDAPMFLTASEVSVYVRRGDTPCVLVYVRISKARGCWVARPVEEVA